MECADVADSWLLKDDTVNFDQDGLLLLVTVDMDAHTFCK